MLDVVYPYKRSPGDFELRYSLRSLENVPHDRVIIAGDLPPIVSQSVTVVRNPRVGGDRYMSSTSNIFAVMRGIDLSEDFIVMNDDIFVLKPWTFQHQHRDTIDAALSDPSVKGDYHARILATRALLRSHGVTDPLFYGLHTPTVYNRSKLVEMMREFPMPRYKYLMRTLYHNLFPQPSIRRDDVKVKSFGDNTVLPTDVLSISDNVAAITEFRNWIDDRFPRPSQYEVAA
jgi:hypothetical protein